MNLEEYIATYRRGNAALTRAEAKIAGMGYPMPSGWLKRNRLMEVDGDAMRAAMLMRRQVVAKKKSVKEAKKARKKARSGAPTSKPRELQISVSVKIAEAPATDDLYARVNAPEFLRSFEWRQLRLKALQKYGRQCQCCGASPASGAVMNVDHVKSRRRFPELALDIRNLQVLCEDCNHGKGNETIDFRAA